MRHISHGILLVFTISTVAFGAVSTELPLSMGFMDIEWGTPSVNIVGLELVNYDPENSISSYKRAAISNTYAGIDFDKSVLLFKSTSLSDDYFMEIWYDRLGVNQSEFLNIKNELDKYFKSVGNKESPDDGFDEKYIWLFGHTRIEFLKMTDRNEACLVIKNYWAFVRQTHLDPHGAIGFVWDESASSVLQKAKLMNFRILDDKIDRKTNMRDIDLGGYIYGYLGYAMLTLQDDKLRFISLAFLGDDLQQSIYYKMLGMLKEQYGEANLGRGKLGQLVWGSGNTVIELFSPDMAKEPPSAALLYRYTGIE
jgi:hypothetical protein